MSDAKKALKDELIRNFAAAISSGNDRGFEEVVYNMRKPKLPLTSHQAGRLQEACAATIDQGLAQQLTLHNPQFVASALYALRESPTVLLNINPEHFAKTVELLPQSSRNSFFDSVEEQVFKLLSVVAVLPNAKYKTAFREAFFKLDEKIREKIMVKIEDYASRDAYMLIIGASGEGLQPSAPPNDARP